MAAEVINPARGTLFQHGTPFITPTYSTVAQVTSIDGPGREVGTRDTTIITDAAETCAPTIVKNGEVSGKVLFDPKGTSHAVMEGLITTPSLEKWQVVLADAAATKLSFNGVLTKWAPTGMAVEANLEADFTVKVSGLVTVT